MGTESKQPALLPCPFCGRASDLDIAEVYRHPVERRSRSGARLQRIGISHRVECCFCGASGGGSFDILEGAVLSPVHVEDSINAAALLWNARHPVNQRAFDLVNRLIVSALQTLEEGE